MQLVTNSEGPTWVVPNNWLPRLSSRVYETLTFASECVSKSLSKKRPLANTGGAVSDPWPTEAVLEYSKNWHKPLNNTKKLIYIFWKRNTIYTKIRANHFGTNLLALEDRTLKKHGDKSQWLSDRYDFLKDVGISWSTVKSDATFGCHEVPSNIMKYLSRQGCGISRNTFKCHNNDIFIRLRISSNSFRCFHANYNLIKIEDLSNTGPKQM